MQLGIAVGIAVNISVELAVKISVGLAVDISVEFAVDISPGLAVAYRGVCLGGDVMVLSWAAMASPTAVPRILAGCNGHCHGIPLKSQMMYIRAHGRDIGDPWMAHGSALLIGDT